MGKQGIILFTDKLLAKLGGLKLFPPPNAVLSPDLKLLAAAPELAAAAPALAKPAYANRPVPRANEAQPPFL